MKRRCKKCGLIKPLRMFYPGRQICRQCVGMQAKRAYVVRTAFPDGATFVCRRCGETKPTAAMSTYARDLCKACHAADLLAKRRRRRTCCGAGSAGRRNRKRSSNDTASRAARSVLRGRSNSMGRRA